jgi:hypothetical protein
VYARCFAALDDQEGAVAVVLDFVDPASAARGMIDCGCELRLDERKRHASLLAESEKIASQQPGRRKAGDCPTKYESAV